MKDYFTEKDECLHFLLMEVRRIHAENNHKISPEGKAEALSDIDKINREYEKLKTNYTLLTKKISELDKKIDFKLEDILDIKRKLNEEIGKKGFVDPKTTIQ